MAVQVGPFGANEGTEPVRVLSPVIVLLPWRLVSIVWPRAERGHGGDQGVFAVGGHVHDDAGVAGGAVIDVLSQNDLLALGLELLLRFEEGNVPSLPDNLFGDSGSGGGDGHGGRLREWCCDERGILWAHHHDGGRAQGVGNSSAHDE